MATATQTRTKSAAKPKTTAARKPATQPKASAKAADRGVKEIVLDSAYATVGLTDSAVAVLRTLPVKAAELRGDAPARVRVLANEAPKQAIERVQAVAAQRKTLVADLRTQAEQQLETFAGRGRQVVGKVQNSAATKRALDQSRIARSQVKAAATSVRKAVGAGAAAADTATDKIGVRA